MIKNWQKNGYSYVIKCSEDIGSKIDRKAEYNDSEFLKINDFVLLLITF